MRGDKGVSVNYLTFLSRRTTNKIFEYFVNRLNIKLQWSVQVSWVRHRDLHILSVGRSVYTKDGRFSVYHQRHTGEWTLQLRSAQLKDSGLYECQIGTQPTRSYFVNLQVVGEWPYTHALNFYLNDLSIQQRPGFCLLFFPFTFSI